MSRTVSLDNHVKQGVTLLAPLRRRWLIAYLWSWLTALLGSAVIAGTWSVAHKDPAIAWCVTGGVILLMLIMRYRSVKRRETLTQNFGKWRAEAVAHINPKASLSADSHVAQSSVDQSLLYRSTYNRYNGRNYIELADLKCSSLSVSHVYQETYYTTESYTDSNGRTQSRQVQNTRTVVKPVFDGTMIEISAPVPHPLTAVLQHPSHGLIRNLEKFRPASSYLLKNYLISVSDQFAGHRMLTPSMQEDIEGFSRSFKYLPGYAYRDDRAYVCLPDFYLSYGSCPSKWRAVTSASLINVVESCKKSIAFLESVTPRLVPDTESHTLQPV